MRIGDTIYWAIRQVKTRLIESLLIILGIGFGIAVICTVLGLIDSSNHISSSAEQFYRQLSVCSIEDHREWSIKDKALTLVRKRDEKTEKPEKLILKDYFKFKEAEIEGTDYIWATSRIPNNGQYLYYMVTPDIFSLAQLELIKGDIFRDADLLNQSRVVVLGKKFAENEFPNQDPIGKQILIDEVNFTVIGVVQTQQDVEIMAHIMGLGPTNELDYHLYVPFSDDEIRDLYFLPAKNVKIEEYYTDLQDYARQHYKNSLAVSGYFLLRQDSQKQIFATSKTIGILAIIALLIAAVNILNLMLARVFRRYKHIGISVAVGASKKEIFGLFISEAIILGIFGSIVGILFSIGATYLMKALLNQQVQFSLVNGLIGIGVAFVTSLLFGFYPASQAAKINPVDALRAD